MNRRAYHFGQSSLILEFGDLTTSDAEVLVSSDDYMLTMGGGVSAAISRAGGEALILDASKKIPARLGDVVVTTAGALPAKYIFHAITIGSGSSELDTEVIIEKTTHRCLELLDTLALNTIAFPAIGAGAAGFSYDDVAVQMAEVIAEDLKARRRPIQVTIYLFDLFRQLNPMDFVLFFEEFGTRVREFSGHEAEITEQGQETETHQTEVPIKSGDANEDTEAVQRRRLAQRLAGLGQERDQLEGKLVELEGGLSEEEIHTIQVRLDEIHHLRLQVLSELQQKSKKGVSVFMSYAHEDEQLRVALCKHFAVLEHKGLITTWYDRRITAGKEWKGEIDRNLESAGIILLLVSADFMDSDYCYDVEMTRALERHERQEGLVVPIILRPVMWQDTPFSKLQALPTDGKPVTTWDNLDSALVDVTEGIKSAIEGFLLRST